MRWGIHSFVNMKAHLKKKDDNINKSEAKHITQTNDESNNNEFNVLKYLYVYIITQLFEH